MKLIKKFKLFLYLILFNLFFIGLNAANNDLEKIISKNVSYLDFLLFKLENKIDSHAVRLRSEGFFVSRLQYEKIISKVTYLKKEEKIKIDIVGVLNKKRYKDKKYTPKDIDCNIFRNIILYNKYGYNIFSGKKNKYLSEDMMNKILNEQFFNNLTISKENINKLINSINLNINIVHPKDSKSIKCSGSVMGDLVKI
jgi:hypothetical protein